MGMTAASLLTFSPPLITIMFISLFNLLYTISLVFLSIYGLNSLLLTILFLVKRRRNLPIPPDPAEWPSITLQLPVFNERYVVERVIDAACALDYPQDKLTIQVLDDSTDETTQIAYRRVEYHQTRGINISLLHRTDRSGYKAGALAAALSQAPDDLISVVDADFIPPCDFFHRLVPYLAADPHLGMVQARWGHLNAGYNIATRGQALFLDGHFVVEQIARSRSGFFFNFNGSGGIWRKSSILDAGGWQSDTLTEDLDLSFRAQLRGCQMVYLPDVTIPGEVPPMLSAFKRQQYRWALGATQVVRKTAASLLTSHLNPIKRLQAFIHLTGYATHFFMLIFLLSCLPVVLNGGRGLPNMPWLSIASIGAPLLFALSQVAVYPDWLRRLVYLPVLFLISIGLAFNNTRGILAGLSGKPGEFTRTPKFQLQSAGDSWRGNPYVLQLDMSVVGELVLAAYAAFTLSLAITHFPPLIPVLSLFTLSFGFMGLSSLLETRITMRIHSKLPLPRQPGD
jgi:cellulose synthase/poly-beta-1,6-N-acetylglucosamine synthase-like glycosyltransferase